MTEISKKAQEAVAKAVAEYPAKWTMNDPYYCAFGVINKTTGAWRYGPSAGSACHANLYSVSREPCIVINAHKPTQHGQNPEFTKWVCREAPFSYAVLNKDNEDEILNHASVMDGELIGQGGCLWLGKALRYCCEDKFRVPLWYQLRELDLDGLQAFVGCSILDQFGSPQTYTTHNSLFSYGTPESLRKHYDEIRKLKRIGNSAAARQGANGNVWGSLKSKKEKRSDGWGGFTEVDVPCDAREFTEKLKEILTGDPKNVK